MKYELCFAPGQLDSGGVIAAEVKKHLEKTHRISRGFSEKDELVVGWLENPSSYPEELKGKSVFLWKSIGATAVGPIVAFLIWNWRVRRLYVDYCWLRRMLDKNDPALLKPK